MLYCPSVASLSILDLNNETKVYYNYTTVDTNQGKNKYIFTL